MNVRLISAALALGVSVFAFGACSDDDETGAGGAGGGTPTSSSGNTGGAGAQGGEGAQGGGGGGVDCGELCGQLYDCGLEEDPRNAGEQLCPGFTGEAAEKSTFVESCTPTCEGNAALRAVFDPENCPGSIGIVAGAEPDTFGEACENGISGAGGAGGGGVGGAGGAGGAGGGN